MSRLNEKLVREISAGKNEQKWLTEFRLRSLKIFQQKSRAGAGPNLPGLKMEKLAYFIKPRTKQRRSWSEVPKDVRRTFEKIGVPQAERKYLAGVGAQLDSGTVYHAYRQALQKKGVVFVDMETGAQKYPRLVKKYFGRLVPPGDNKYAALNSAVWSGGSFVYVPKGVRVGLPLQAYFRINAKSFGQFERTLIIADEGSEVHYIEGCSAPTYSQATLHAAVVEIFVGRNARVKYTTIQNWSKDVFNLVTKRARVEAGARMEWVDGNFGAGVTMKYPACVLAGRGAHGEMLSISSAGAGQHQDTGARMIHLAPETTSVIVSKSMVRRNGRATFRGLVRIMPEAKRAAAKMKCETLMLDAGGKTETYPAMDIRNGETKASHEASVSKIDQEQLFYLMSRGLSEKDATSLMIGGFVEPIMRDLPFEYAVELNKLVALEMQGSVG